MLRQVRTVAIPISLAALLAPSVAPLAAQGPGEGDGDRMVWVTGGLGTGSQDLAAAASLDIAWSDHIVSLRAAGVLPGVLFETGDRYSDVGLLYGHAVRWSLGIAAL